MFRLLLALPLIATFVLPAPFTPVSLDQGEELVSLKAGGELDPSGLD